MGILRDAIGGAAETGKNLLLEQIKAETLAKRDAALAKVRAQETKANQEFRTKEREAGQMFTSKESVKKEAAHTARSKASDTSRRESAKDTANIRYNAKKTGLEIIASQGIFNHDTGVMEPFPTSPKEMSRQALKMAETMVANGTGGFKADGETEKNIQEVRADVLADLKIEAAADKKLREAKPKAKPKKEKLKGGGPVLFKSSVKYGSQDIRESDITRMMTRYNLSREDVVSRLQGK